MAIMCVEVAVDLPTRLSMRLSATNDFGGALDLWGDVPRWDGGGTSRWAGHACRKDWRIAGVHGTNRSRDRKVARELMGKL